jgi:hypothetical protein
VFESACRSGIHIVIFASDPALFATFPNVCEKKLSVRKLSFDALFEGTPLKEWYDFHSNRNSSLWKYDVPDAARWAVVKKYGGIYSDADILFFGNQLVKQSNKVAAQHDDPTHGHFYNGNFLDFEKGHPFVDRAIKEFISRYEPEHDWGAPGPALLTATVNVCEEEKGSDCRTLTRLDADKLQYLRPGSIREQLSKPISDPDTQDLRNRLLGNGLGLHFSNSEIGVPKFPAGSLFHTLFNEFCPVVSGMYSRNLLDYNISMTIK